MTDETKQNQNDYTGLAKVVSVIDSYKVAINRGKQHDLRVGSRFLVFKLGDEIIDPDTNISLGMLEIVRGQAKVVHLQDQLATLESVEIERQRGKKRIIKSAFSVLGQEIIEDAEDIQLPLDASIGDYARPI